MKIVKLFLGVFLSISLMAQDKTEALVQTKLKAAYKKAYPASVRAYGIDSVSGAQNSAQFSAVVVSDDGVLLTVAHAVMPGRLYAVSFPDGKTTRARALGRIVTDQKEVLPDVAMMKIIEPGNWPYVNMGTSGSLVSNQLCFGISYPESQNLKVPMLRFGYILRAQGNYGFVESTCIMETGDSGGPLFDENGCVIAFHSRIDQPEGISYEVPVDLYKKYFSAIQKPINYDSLPIIEDAILPDNKEKLKAYPDFFKDWTNNKFADSPGGHSVLVSIYSGNSASPSIYGTVFKTAKGAQYIISKSSCVEDDSYVLIKNEKKKVTIIRRDRATDLVALKVDDFFPQAILQKDLGIANDEDIVGTLLTTSLLNGSSKKSVGGLVVNNLPNRFSGGSLGASLREVNGLPTIIKLDPGGPAEKAGFKEGDKIFKVNNTVVNGAAAFNNEMSYYFFGDTVRFSVRRDSTEFQYSLQLVPQVFREQPHPMNHFEGGKSVRRDGFNNVIFHDAPLRSFECGSPLYNLSRKIVGFNIARFSHVTTVALSVSALNRFVGTL